MMPLLLLVAAFGITAVVFIEKTFRIESDGNPLFYWGEEIVWGYD